MLQRLQAFKLSAAALAAPVALLSAAPALAAADGVNPVTEAEAVELAQLRFPRLRMPSVPRIVFAIA